MSSSKINKRETKIAIPCSPEEYYYKLDNMVLCSSQYVRNTFKTRWKVETGEDWVDDKEFIGKFIKGHGRNAYKQAQSFQKKILKESSGLDDWDMSLLSVVILNFGDEAKYDKENTAVRQLKMLRNELAHKPSKKFTETKYDKNVKIFKDALLCLGLCESDIDKLVEKAGVTSSLKAYERVKEQFREAEEFMTKENFTDAIEQYSEAIATPSLLLINLGETYEKRANCYLKSVKSEVVDGDHCDQALMDVQQALELNSSSWNANYLAAQCYRRKNNLSKALRYYETALALSPAQRQVKRDLDTCKVLAGVYASKEILNPRLMPMNLEERVANFNNETGMQVSKEQFIIEHRDLAGMVIKGQDHVFRGHQFYCGWGVEQSFTEAVKYYTKADQVGNPEGSYNLAMCYHYGRGVDGDVERALKIYKRVANMDRTIYGQLTPLNYNVGVAAAQHAVGLCYANGTGVEQDYKEAAVWYKKAMENGIGDAANGLALLYSKGQGVQLDEKMAEMCWKQGVSLKDLNSADSLVGYYINQMEPEIAQEWIKIGRKLGSDNLRGTSDEEFNKIFARIKSHRENFNPMVTDFEEKYNLETKGLTFRERWTRALKQVNPNIAKLFHVCKLQAIEDLVSPTYVENLGGKVQSLTPAIIQALFEKAWQGSTIAIRIIRTIKICVELEHLLKSNTTNNSKEFKLKLLNMLYKCTILEFQFFCIKSREIKQRLKSIVAELFLENCERKGEEDLKFRFCYIVLNLRATLFKAHDTYTLEILKEGVRRYPDNPYYHELLICCMGGRKLWKEGVLCAKEALAKSPDNVDLLYHFAVCLQGCETADYSKVVSAYEKFLDIAPSEHRKVPEAFYNIALVRFMQFKNRSTQDILDIVRLYVRRGEEAEEDQLPCYLPYGESIINKFIKGFLGAMDDIKNTAMNGCRQSNLFVQPKSVLERKPYMSSPGRKDVILQHRKNLKETNDEIYCHQSTIPPKLTQPVAKKLSTLKSITLREMNPAEDNIFDNCYIELTLIEDPNPCFTSIHLVGEDNNGDTTRLYIYNTKKDAETMERFEAGCRIAIIYPYMRISALNSSNGIRNDETKCIVDLEKVKKMCRFCGERNSILICTKCKRPYCSPECVNLDLELFDHKLICSKK